MTGRAPTTRLERTSGPAGSYVIVAAAIVTFIALSLLKPWAGGDVRGRGAAVGAAETPRAVALSTPRVAATASDTFTRLLERARPYAGRRVVIGRAIPRYGTPVTTVLHRPSGRAKTNAANAGWCAGGIWFDSPQRAVALGHKSRVAPAVDVAIIARGGGRAPVRLAAAPKVEGLVLVAPAGGMGWLPGRYAVTLTYAERGGLARVVERFMLCFRTPPRTTP